MIRQMTVEDLPRVLEIENELFQPFPWPEKEYLYELNENPFAKIYLIIMDDEVAGFADLWITYEQAQIANIGISRRYQRRGLGEKLLSFCTNEAIGAECENLTLEVRKSNAPAIALYEKMGFITAATRKNYYEDGEDAFLMIKPIGGLEYDTDFCD